MDTQETLTNNHELPSPTPNTAVGTAGSPEMGQSHEQHASPGAPQSATAQLPLDPATQLLANAAPVVSPGQATTVTAHLSADDADLIEKEWVLKAKEIVARTHGDPYVQNNEINKIKADYIKKRYNKDIKQITE